MFGYANDVVKRSCSFKRDVVNLLCTEASGFWSTVNSVSLLAIHPFILSESSSINLLTPSY